VDDSEDRRLIEAWQDVDGAASTDDCPPAERIWEAAQGRLTVAERLAVIDHVTQCPACVEAWRLARAMDAPAGVPAVSTRQAPYAWRAMAWPAAAAALLVAASIAVLWPLPPPPTDRDPTARRLETITPNGAVLSREAFVLRWKPGPPGSRYRVVVTTDALDVIRDVRGLEVAEHVVPRERLADVAPGTRLRWRVMARAPDGTGIDSPTLSVIVR
jgi:hypothetical protein